MTDLQPSQLILCQSNFLCPYKNLAIEEIFCQQLRPGQTGLYLWRNENTVVIGRHQNAWQECNLSALERDNVHLARRKTGGGAVFHDAQNLNFTFLSRKEDYSPRKNYIILLNALRLLGIPASLSGRNDITVDDKKFSGNAFFKGNNTAYHHGTIMVGVNMERLARYLNVHPLKLKAKGVPSVRSHVINLIQICPSLTISQLEESIQQAWMSAYDYQRIERFDPDAETTRPAIQQAEQAFASTDWILGQNPDPVSKIETRFPWGGITILHNPCGEILLYSDALDADLIGQLQAHLRQSQAKDLTSFPLTGFNPQQRQIIQDVNGLLTKETPS